MEAVRFTSPSRPHSTAISDSGSVDPFGTPPYRHGAATPMSAGRRSVVNPGISSTTESNDSASKDVKALPRRRKFKSSRLTDEVYPKPWVQEKTPRKKWERIIFFVSIVIGLAVGGILFFFAYTSVTNLEDNFETINPDTWGYEIQRGGFGSSTFEWTTNDPANAYTDSEGLHIVPTLTLDTTNITYAQMNDSYVLNMTTSNTCTAKSIIDCSIRSNFTSGAIINPVRSARLTTQGKVTLKYGRVEVVAKMPRGDWLWPAIWMMPENSVYGEWPQSGEIDIAEGRGNPVSYPDGVNSIGGTLHWGPIAQADAFWRTTGKHNLQRGDYSDGFHTYGLEWNENYLFVYLDSRLLQTLFIKFNKPFWQLGQFATMIYNHSALANPWAETTNNGAPFDQEFFLILNVAVGSTNGYFKDGIGNKPWADGSLSAPREFWNAQSTWLPTWGMNGSQGMTVKSVKMWTQGACGSSGATKK